MNNEKDIYCIKCKKNKCDVEIKEGKEIVYCSNCGYLEYEEWLEFTIINEE